MSGKIIIAGALGLVGRSILEHFEGLLDWDIIALARRTPEFPSRARFIPVDLLDRSDCAEKLASCDDATHIVYAALFEKPMLAQGWTEADQIAANLTMLTNLLDVTVEGNPRFRHLALLQGGKAYGAHLGQVILPAKEHMPRHIPPNFYYAQEDMVRARQAGEAWAWTVLRPMVILGFSLGSPMNIMEALMAYAAICRELDLPLRFPGSGMRNLMEATDARLLARAIAWSGSCAAARNAIFNVTNGDIFLWENIWPDLSRRLGFEPALGQPLPLATIMADKADLWMRIVERHGLRDHPLHAVAGASWPFADSIFGYHGIANSALLSTIKIRRAGFHDCIDTEEAIADWIDIYRRIGIAP